MSAQRIVRPPRRVEAEAIIREMNRGKHGALLVTVRDGREGEPFECIVKLDARLLMPPAEHMKEWVAAELARHLGVVVPEPLEVTIPAELAETVDGFKLRCDIRDAKRPVFGSTFVPGLVPPMPNETLSVDVRLAAAELIAFDVLTHNSDRRRTNPNVLVSRTQVVAFDHGDAFAFLLPLIGSPDDPERAPLLNEVVKDHIFGQSFSSRTRVSFQRFRDALLDLDDGFFDALGRATPAAWTDRAATGMLERAFSILRHRRDAVDFWLPQVETWIFR